MHDCPCCGEAVYTDDPSDMCSCCEAAECDPDNACNIPTCPECDVPATFCTDGKWHPNCDPDECPCAREGGGNAWQPK